MPDMDLVLDRITYHPEHTELSEIPWPDGMAPAEAPTALNYDGTLPECDAVVMTWTAAEAKALADVLTPGAPSTGWTHYARNWSKYLDQLTGRSPAREADRLGEFHMCSINGLKVLCFHSQLHPATDGPTLPTAQLAQQIATETGCKLFVTTGTAGGVGEGVVLGDVNVAVTSSSLFTTRLKGNSWSKETWQTAPLNGKQKELLGPSVLPDLLAANSGGLPKEWAPRPPQAWYGDGVSTDFFAMGDATDHYGLLAYRPDCRAVDMDDAAVCLGLSRMNSAPAVAASRCASDPTMPNASAADLKEAEQIYQKWGYTAAVGSVICSWALVAGLDQE